MVLCKIICLMVVLFVDLIMINDLVGLGYIIVLLIEVNIIDWIFE